MGSLRISSSLSLPRKAATWVLAYLAKRGAGKTYAAAVQAEEMLKAGIPIVVIDGMGTWWGLRVSKDRKSNGMPVIVFGGDHQDLPLLVDKAQQMARAIVQSNISCVLDLSSVSKTQARKLLATFLDELYRLNRAERHVFIEEADLWAPQKVIGPEQLACLGAVDNFVRRGGNRNLGCTLITQRSAVLNKDILTQSDCLVVLRTLAPQDKKAIEAWVEEHTDEDRKEVNRFYDSLKELENGEAWVWHPEKPEIFQKVQFRERETFHATREFIVAPQASSIKLMGVDEFVFKFKEAFEPGLTPVQQRKITPGPRTEQSTIRRGLPEFVVSAKDPMLNDHPRSQPIEVLPSITREGDVSVQQSLPNIRIEQLKPTVALPVEILDQPTSALGRVAVVLKNKSQNVSRQDQYTVKGIRQQLADHAWEDGGVDEAVQQLLRWEILKKVASGMMRLDPQRIQIVEREAIMEIR